MREIPILFSAPIVLATRYGCKMPADTQRYGRSQGGAAAKVLFHKTSNGFQSLLRSGFSLFSLRECFRPFILFVRPQFDRTIKCSSTSKIAKNIAETLEKKVSVLRWLRCFAEVLKIGAKRLEARWEHRKIPETYGILVSRARIANSFRSGTGFDLGDTPLKLSKHLHHLGNEGDRSRPSNSVILCFTCAPIAARKNDSGTNRDHCSHSLDPSCPFGAVHA
ncbi:hypothetical protein ACVKN3_001735 [Luteibacter sp. PvP120]